MSTPVYAPLWLGLILSTLGAQACGGQPVGDATIAKAVTIESKSQKEAEELAQTLAARKAQQQADRQALQQRRQSEIDAAIGLPSPMPADLEAACDAYVEAYDGFIKSGGDREVQEFYDGRRAELGERRAKCVTLGSVQVAACGSKVLQGEYPSLNDLTRHDAAHRLLETCARKFGAV